MNWRGLLVSVRDADEAAAAVVGGAAIVDVKEPSRGPLGAVDAETAASVARAVGGRVPWTMACGEIADVERAADGHRASPGPWAAVVGGRGPFPAAVKIGLASAAGTSWQRRLADALATLPAEVERVAVAYADWKRATAPPPEEVISSAWRIGCGTLLIDTFDKAASGLFGCCAAAAPAAWVLSAREAGLRVTVAGRITLEQIPRAWDLGPDVVAVRSAVCWGGREGTVRAALVRRAVEMGPAGNAAAAPPPPAGVWT